MARADRGGGGWQRLDGRWWRRRSPGSSSIWVVDDDLESTRVRVRWESFGDDGGDGGVSSWRLRRRTGSGGLGSELWGVDGGRGAAGLKKKMNSGGGDGGGCFLVLGWCRSYPGEVAAAK